MSLFKPKTETIEEALKGAFADAKLIQTFEQEQLQRHEQASAELADASGDHPEATQRLIAASAAVAASPKVVEAARKRIASRSRLLAIHLQGLADELTSLHEQSAKIVREGVQDAIIRSLGKLGYWTNPELAPLVVRARPMREQHTFESQHQSGTHVGFDPDPESSRGGLLISESSIRDPRGLISDITRLTASVAAAKQRLDAVKREFNAN